METNEVDELADCGLDRDLVVLQERPQLFGRDRSLACSDETEGGIVGRRRHEDDPRVSDDHRNTVRIARNIRPALGIKEREDDLRLNSQVGLKVCVHVLNS